MNLYRAFRAAPVYYYYLYFTNEETKVMRRTLTCPRSFVTQVGDRARNCPKVNVTVLHWTTDMLMAAEIQGQ